MLKRILKTSAKKLSLRYVQWVFNQGNDPVQRDCSNVGVEFGTEAESHLHVIDS